jgi:hypothetical protein
LLTSGRDENQALAQDNRARGTGLATVAAFSWPVFCGRGLVNINPELE